MSTEQESEGPARESQRSGVLVNITRWMENLGDTGFAYLLLTPVFILLGAIALYPLLRTFELSLYADDIPGAANRGEFIGIQNYVDLLSGEKDAILSGTFLPTGLSTDAILGSAVGVTLVFTIIGVFFETLIGFGQALVLDQEFPGRKWVRAAIIIPWAVPIVIQGMIFYLMFNPGVGFATGLLSGTNPLNDVNNSLLIIIVADIWKTSAFMALLILAGLQSIDRGLYDVARVAGASKWQSFKMITLPLVLPSVGIAMLFRTVQAMRVYGIIDIASSCAVVPSLSCVVVNTFTRRQGTSATVAFVTAALIGLAVSVIIIQQAREGF